MTCNPKIAADELARELALDSGYFKASILKRVAPFLEAFAKEVQDEALEELESREMLIGRIEELERRARLRVGTLPCGGCGGPHRYDTSVPSVVWNAVIRARELSEYLCTSCIVREFVRARTSFTATLYGDFDDANFRGEQIEVRVGGAVAEDAARLSEENSELRWKLHEANEKLQALRGESGQPSGGGLTTSESPIGVAPEPRWRH